MGLIPAHAGKTRAPFWHSACQAAHPRSRGENTTRPRPRRKGWGSSPLTRGKLSFLWCVVSDERLIPAHAGKTAKNALKRSLTPGSSPLTRGKRSSTTLSLACQRLIPAHAGKTRRPRSSRAGGPAHPRSRGENSGMASRPRSTTGSSPLTRGKHVADLTRAAHGRLIPAHAGKTALTRRWASCGRAHPRSRGENRLPP